jgi:hypothetical protein
MLDPDADLARIVEGRRQCVIGHGGLDSLAQPASVADPARHLLSERALGLAHEVSLHPSSISSQVIVLRAAASVRL